MCDVKEMMDEEIIQIRLIEVSYMLRIPFRLRG